MSKDYKEILETLEDIQENITTFDLKKHLEGFRETDFFRQFENQFLDFSHDVQTAVDEAARAVQSPIYVGVIGHYSHGKSSLLNAMIFPPKAKEILPTGESIVTSKCTLMQFTADSSNDEYFEITNSGEERFLGESEYQTKVSGKRSGVIQDLHHFRVVLSTNNLSDSIFRDMADRHIEMLDTPGLGGPYWKDEHALQQWIKEFMLLIVCVKADQINTQTASVINPFLKQTSRPVIPVVTFWDLWQKSPAYKGISDEMLAREKAKDDIRRYIPAMADAVDENRVLFVSAKKYRDQSPVPSDATHMTTSDWNIDSLRSSLSSYISERRSVLQSLRSQESCLDQSRREAVLASCRLLSAKYSSLRPMLIKVVGDLKPKEQWEEQLLEDVETIRDKTISEFERIVDRLDQVINDGISSISPRGNIAIAFSEIQENTNKILHEQLTGSFRDVVSRQMERTVKRHLERFIDDDTPLTIQKKKRCKDDIRECCNDFIEKIGRIEQIHAFIPPQGVTDLAWNLGKAIVAGFKQLFLTNFPMAAIMIGIIIAWPIVSWVLSWIPGIGQYITVISISIGVLIMLAVLAIFSREIKSATEKTKLEVKEKARKANRRADIRNRVIPSTDRLFSEFQQSLREIIKDTLEPIQEGSNQMLDDVESMVKDIGDNVKIIEKKCDAIMRNSRR